MKDDYLSKIRKTTCDEKIYFNLDDIKQYLIEDYDYIISKLKYNNIELNPIYNKHIDLYTLILLICFSNDLRVFKYKFFLIYSTIREISEIKNPNLALDRVYLCKYKNGYQNGYTYKSNTFNELERESFNDIINDEINFSMNIDLIRQII